MNKTAVSIKASMNIMKWLSFTCFVLSVIIFFLDKDSKVLWVTVWCLLNFLFYKHLKVVEKNDGKCR
jgi:hypothetical protein